MSYETFEAQQYAKMSTTELFAERARLRKQVDENDGRLSTSSSAQLDYEIECLEEVEAELGKRRAP